MFPRRILSTAVLTAAIALVPVTADAVATPHAQPALRAAGAVHHRVTGAHRIPVHHRVRVVPAGQRVDLGHGGWMTLTDTERCVGDADGFSCKSVVDGNQPPGTVGLQSFGDSTRTLYSPLYIGPGKAARMTVAVDGVTYRARVVTLAGDPGYATGYAWVANDGAPAGKSDSRPEVTVYDAAGTVLAKL
ncbi:hypothetical protein ACWCV9_19770 [Streptomyces sp. NPDC001606]